MVLGFDVPDPSADKHTMWYLPPDLIQVACPCGFSYYGKHMVGAAGARTLVPTGTPSYLG
jgi:hypothetical protein